MEDEINTGYPREYNELISQIYEDSSGSFAAIASPTLSKQETVTALYKIVTNAISKDQKKSPYPWKLFLKFVPRVILMFTFVCFASIRYRFKKLPPNAIILKTWLVPKSFSNGTLCDDYFRNLESDLSKYKNVVTIYTPLDYKLLWKFSNVKKNKHKYISYGVLSILDVIKLFYKYISDGPVRLKKNYLYKGIDITDFINKSLITDYMGMRSFLAYAEKFNCKKIAQQEIDAFIYVFENQSWEKACCLVLKNYDVKIIGYQSSGFSPIFLNFFPTKKDSVNHPMPSMLLTVGDNFSKYLKKNGNYAIPVITFAALRFPYTIKKNKYIVSRPNTKILKRILCALPVHIEEYKQLINRLIKIFSDIDVHLEIKIHPLYELSEISEIKGLPSNFTFIKYVSMDSLGDKYDCVLFNDNSFGIEALLKGVKSYQIKTNNFCMENRFIFFDLWKVNYEDHELRTLIQSIANDQYDKNFDYYAVIEYINNMYKPYDEDSLKNFLNFINKKHVIKN
jgi:hypothetical protein